MTTSTPRSVRSWACRAVPRAGSGHAADPLKFDVIGLLARHPKMAQRFLSYKGWLLQRGELPLRLRELAILRVAHSRRSAFFWGEHVKVAGDGGVSAGDIERLAGCPCHSSSGANHGFLLVISSS